MLLEGGCYFVKSSPISYVSERDLVQYCACHHLANFLSAFQMKSAQIEKWRLLHLHLEYGNVSLSVPCLAYSGRAMTIISG